MKKKIVIAILIVFTTMMLPAQQIGMYSHYFYKPMLYNPALAGLDNTTNAALISRNQWNDFKAAPKLNMFTIDGSLLDNKVGVGFNLINDRKGITNRTTGSLCYSYKLDLGNDMRLLLGLSLGVTYQSLDFSKTLVENNSDPNLFTSTEKKTALDANAGLAFVWKGLELSFAMPQLFQNKINYVDYSNVRGYYAMARHYMISVKYKINLIADKGVSLTPQALVRFVPNAPVQFDGILTADWKDKCWLGFIYKSSYAVAINVGFVVHKQLSIGYSYDFVTGSIGNYSGASHELMMNYKFASSPKIDAPADATPSKSYEDLITSLQTELLTTEDNIKELEDRLKKKQKEQGLKKGDDVGQDLSDLIIENLLKKIDAMLDNRNATKEEIQGLRDEISTYFDSDFSDKSVQKKLRKKYDALGKANNISSVLVKGVLKLPKTTGEANYSNLKIVITEKEGNKVIGTYLPNAKTGRYIFILTPGNSYVETVEGAGYQTYTEEFAPAKSRESYEMSQEIRMQEEQK